MNKFLIAFIAIGLLSIGCTQKISPAPGLYTTALQIGSQKLLVQTVTLPADMQHGLSDRVSMNENQGMLFNFGTSSTSGFWMKDMKFNLDFIWITNGKVTGITPDISRPNS